MSRFTSIGTLLLAAAALVTAAPSAAADGGGMTFNVVKLPTGRGGEPSITTDRQGDVYVTAPVGFPAASKPGANIWISRDHGRTFTGPTPVGSYTGGGDTDVVVPEGDSKTVYLTDLEASAAAVCVSHDAGKTFSGVGPTPDPNNCSVIVPGQVGPSNDRQWLTAGRNGRVYLTYHEFNSAQPAIFRDDKYGADAFADGPCGPIVTDPTIEPNVLNDVTAGSLVSKPVLDDAGNLYILFTTPTQQQQAAAIVAGHVSPTYSQAYMAVSNDGCQTFTDYTIFDGTKLGTNSVQFGDDFNVLSIDGKGNLYGTAAGYVGTTSFPSPTTANVFMFSSTDKGKTWKGPIQVTKDIGAHMLPAAVGGAYGGELAMGYFRAVNGKVDPNDATAQWTYTVAETTNATDAHPTFTFTDVKPGAIYHKGDICNSGLLCGTPAPGAGKDRTLADFTSATLDAGDCPLFNFGGNPTSSTVPYVAIQTSGCFGTAAATVSAPVAAPSPATKPPLPDTSAGAVRPNPLVPVGLGLFVLYAVLAMARRMERR